MRSVEGSVPLCLPARNAADRGLLRSWIGHVAQASQHDPGHVEKAEGCSSNRQRVEFTSASLTQAHEVVVDSPKACQPRIKQRVPFVEIVAGDLNSPRWDWVSLRPEPFGRLHESSRVPEQEIRSRSAYNHHQG